MRKEDKYSERVLPLKREAALLKKEMSIKSSHAHEIIAKSYGYKTWISLLADDARKCYGPV